MTTTPLRLVIGFVGLVVLLCVLGIILLAYKGNPVPDELKILAVSALTGLIGVLVPTRTNDTGR